MTKLIKYLILLTIIPTVQALDQDETKSQDQFCSSLTTFLNESVLDRMNKTICTSTMTMTRRGSDLSD
jgi:hypothetical protein